MTKAQLQSELYSAKLELEHVIKQLQFRVDFQNIEKLDQDSDQDMHFAKKAGALEAWAHMSNNDMSIAIKNLTKVVKDLDNCK